MFKTIMASPRHQLRPPWSMLHGYFASLTCPLVGLRGEKRPICWCSFNCRKPTMGTWKCYYGKGETFADFKTPVFLFNPSCLFFPGSKEGWRWFLPRLLENCWPRRPSLICEPQWLMLHVLKSGTLQGKTARRQSRCTAGARLQNLSWQRLFGAGRSVRVSKITPRLHLPSSGFFDIISWCLNLTRNLLSWNLTRALGWKIRCLGGPNASLHSFLQQARNSLFQG